MKRFEITGVKDTHCLFCGTRVGYNEETEWGQCEHLVFHSTDDGIPDNDVEGGVNTLLDGFDNEGDELWIDFLEKKLDDSYLMIEMYVPAPSFYGVYLIFKE